MENPPHSISEFAPLTLFLQFPPADKRCPPGLQPQRQPESSRSLDREWRQAKHSSKNRTHSPTHLAAHIAPLRVTHVESLRSFGEGEIFDFRYCNANHGSRLEAPFGFAPCNNGTDEPGPKAFRLRRGSLPKRLLPQPSISTPALGRSGSPATPRVLLVVACYGRHAAGGEAS